MNPGSVPLLYFYDVKNKILHVFYFPLNKIILLKTEIWRPLVSLFTKCSNLSNNARKLSGGNKEQLRKFLI